MHAVAAPDVQTLLPPLFACLPTAFVSSRPPPALLPLLSPILRQRVHLLANSGAESRQNWLTLLSWRQEYAQRLVTVVSDLHLEPHPVSGELELFSDDPDAARVEYKRLDEETLEARCEVRQHGLAVVWMWCVNDSGAAGLDALMNAENGDETKVQDGWRVAEVLPLEDEDGNPVAADGWAESMQAAETAFAESAEAKDKLLAEPKGPIRKPSAAGMSSAGGDEDDYWARYDSTPGPMSNKPSPAPQKTNGGYFEQKSQHQVSELDYYAQYSNVQPALDAHDPDEEESARDAHSTLHSIAGQHAAQATTTSSSLPSRTMQDLHTDHDDQRQVHSPSPKRLSSAGSSVAEHLESTVSDDSPAEAGVKQHISYEMKSLYRLARRTGIERSEFERIVRLELETLDVLEL